MQIIFMSSAKIVDNDICFMVPGRDTIFKGQGLSTLRIFSLPILIED